MTQTQNEAKRLEELWAGDFGNAYNQRNTSAANGRGSFWKPFFGEFPVQSVCEVGCNIGANLKWIRELKQPAQIFGVDINQKALEVVRKTYSDINVVVSPARHLPFRDASFDLVFTTGVLIHQPPASLPLVMSEIVRCSKRYILCGEYFSETPTEVPYRGQSGALFKTDFGALYQDLFPQIKLVKKGFLSKQDGWDDVTVWIFEK